MSKMPAKKKSCFQITSVTQAQVAASSATDDTESLDDPDESRTEDVASEIFDVSRADYEPVCDRSSSEEALNTAAEADAPGAMAPQHIPQIGQSSALSNNPSGGFRIIGVMESAQNSQQGSKTGAGTSLPLITQPGAIQQPPVSAGVGGPTGVLVNVSQPAPTTSSTPSSSTVSCSSRFRVIKLDHGTGEPFRRGRWTCTEFYEKDSETSVVSRTVDGIRHTSATVDPGSDRDSGLGHTGGSVLAPAPAHSGQGLGSVAADASLSASRVHPLETLQQQHHQSYGAGQQGAAGSTAMQNAFSGNKPTSAPAQQPSLGGPQAVAAQNLLPNSLTQAGGNLQKSPMMPPAAQPVAYPPQQQALPLGHHLSNQSPGFLQNQTEYYQPPQTAPLQPGVSVGQSLPVTSFSAMPQGPMPAAGGVSLPNQAGDMGATLGGSLPSGQAGSGMGGVGGSMLVGAPVGQYAPSGQPLPHGLHPAPPGVQNVPAAAVSSGVPAAVTSASSTATPILSAFSLPPGQQFQLPHSNAGILGGLGAQGLAAFGFGQVETGGGKKPEGLTNAQAAVVSGKDLMKPFITPTVDSLFGISIHVDGDEDRNPSKAFYQAFQSGSRLRDSKAHSDSASGTSVVAIDNKIEQAMDLVKSHLMYAVREEVEVLKEQIKELFERNSVLEKENAVLKSLANSEQLSQLSTQPPPAAASTTSGTPPQQALGPAQPLLQLQAPAVTPQLPAPPQAPPQPDPGQQLQPNVTSA